MPTLVPNFSEGALHISFFMHPFLLLKVCDVTRRDAARCDTLHPSSIGDEGSRATNGCFLRVGDRTFFARVLSLCFLCSARSLSLRVALGTGQANLRLGQVA